MKKQIIVKIIGSAIIFSFAMFFLQAIILPSQASAAALNWDNPNASGNNPYKFKPSDILNSQNLMQVVGCTGVVDKISGAITGLFQKKIREKQAEIYRKALVKACTIPKKTAVSSSAIVPNVSVVEVPKLINCNELIATDDAKAQQGIIDTATKATASKTMEECFNGIAFTLAKNQLTSMTKQTMNWVNSGFNGDPMYVRNITSLTDSIAKTALDSSINILNDNTIASPYASDFSRSLIGNYRNGNALENGANGFLSSLSSSLTNFITNPNSYYDTNTKTWINSYGTNPNPGISSQGTYGVNTTKTAVEQAKEANNLFANDFLLGGWNGYLAVTQIDKNNQLGYSMIASQALDDIKNKEVQNTKDEVAQNNGFLSQKKCNKWQWFDNKGKPLKEKSSTVGGLMAVDVFVYKQNKSNTIPNSDVCVSYEVVTPGTIIKDKLNTYINSPERQLELADTINEALNSLFTSLIANFQNQGLSSLKSEDYKYTSANMGVGPGSNSIDLFSDGSGTGGYKNGSFDLTHDLGNRFIHNYQQTSLGDWNAKTNVPELAIGVAPVDGNGYPVANVYYTVNNGVGSNGKNIVGQTKLFENGYNNWEKGDRAFWDGSNWQNWKKEILNIKNGERINVNPIAKRGVIQIQKDYIVSAKEILMKLPAIMPKIGELDYCIPGPNPNWNNNTLETSALFGDFAGSITVEFKKGSLFKRKTNTYSIAKRGDPEYDDYYDVFKYTTPKWWTDITRTSYWNGLISRGNMGTVKGSQSKLDGVQKGVDDYLAKINTDTKIFYDIASIYLDSIYGPKSLMQTQFIEHENTATLESNTAWLPMSSEGIDITKDIIAYNEDTIKTANDYKDAIIKTNSNISNLNLIKNKVSVIIKAAQTRRENKLIELLKGTDYKGMTDAQARLAYKTKYATCFAEEYNIYYDDLSIMGPPPDEKDRCIDGLDNDLDGLVDDLDPDCNSYTTPTEADYPCVLDTTLVLASDPNDATVDMSSIWTEDHTGDDPVPDDNTYCTDRKIGECTQSLYYNNGMGMKCRSRDIVVTQGGFSSTTSPIFGVATQDIDKGSMGQLIMNGTLSGVDTNNWATGTKLYLSNTTAGAMTNIPPNISSEGPIGSVAKPGEINVGSANNYYDVNSFLQIEAGEDLKKGDLLVVSSSGSVSQLIVLKALGKQ